MAAFENHVYLNSIEQWLTQSVGTISSHIKDNFAILFSPENIKRDNGNF